MPYTLAYLQENDFQNGMNVTWQLLLVSRLASKEKRIEEQLFKLVFLKVYPWFFGWVEIEDGIHSLQRYAPGSKTYL